MNLKQFAQLAGVRVVVCGPGWDGGPYGFTTADCPQCTTCGYRSHTAAYRGWLDETFGPTVGAAVCMLLDDSRQPEPDWRVEWYERQNAWAKDLGYTGIAAALDALQLQNIANTLPEKPIYYMRDNHTFRALSDDVDTAVKELEEELRAGYTGGMLCTRRDTVSPLHPKYPFQMADYLADARRWLERVHNRKAIP